MSQILTDTAFAFLPALVAWSTMKKFGGTPVIGIVLGLMLVASQLPNAYAIAGGEAQPIPMDIFGITVLGFIAASKLRWGVTVALAIVFELFTLWTIRDNLTLNVLMLVRPVEAVREWQMQGAPTGR